MRPELTTPLGDCQTEDRPSTDQTGPQMGPPGGLCPSPGQLVCPWGFVPLSWTIGVPLGVCAPLLDNWCAPMIPPSEFGDVWLKLSTLVCSVLGQESFSRSVPVSSLEPSLYFPKCCALPGCLLHTRRFLHQKLMSDSSKEAPWLPINWFGRK